MILYALKIFEAIGEISEVFIEEAGNMYFDQKKVKKTIKYGAIGLAASIGVAGIVWVYQAKRERKKTVKLKAS